MPDQNMNCIQCGDDFLIAEGEIKFYQSKSLYLPKRCKNCREKRKLEKLQQQGQEI